MNLAVQVYPEDSLGQYNAYLNATQETYGCLLLHLTQNTKDGLRFHTHIFPDDTPPLSL